MHGSILPTESTKTGCFCADTCVHTQRAAKPSMSLRSAKARVVCAQEMDAKSTIHFTEMF